MSVASGHYVNEFEDIRKPESPWIYYLSDTDF